ncbi:MAG: hypothetical protein ACOCWH_06815 [Spirochaetota bacterium]
MKKEGTIDVECHTKPVHDILQALGASISGFSEEEASIRKTGYGL